MTKQILFKNHDNQTEISMQFNESEEDGTEVMVEINSDNPWYSFTDPAELQEFIDELQKLQSQLATNTD